SVRELPGAARGNRRPLADYAARRCAGSREETAHGHRDPEPARWLQAGARRAARRLAAGARWIERRGTQLEPRPGDELARGAGDAFAWGRRVSDRHGRR